MRKLLLALTILSLVKCGTQNSTLDSSASKGPLFEWNFSEQRKFIYTFEQDVVNEMGISIDSPKDKSKLRGDGLMTVRVKEDSLADLSLLDLKISMQTINEDGTESEPTTQNSPPIVVQDMSPAGKFKSANPNALFEMLIPLPKKDLKEGETYELPMQFPFNAGGSSLYIKGHNSLTFSGYKTIRDRKCAVLNGVLDISKLDIPEELKGQYSGSVTGETTYYFDLENGFYVGADVLMVMDVFIDSTTKEDTEAGVYGDYLDAKNENTFKIRLKTIEEI